MKKPTRTSLAILISGAALAAALSATAAFAEENHRGRGSDDVVTRAPAANIDDNDVNDDHGVDAVVPTTTSAPTVAVDDND